MDQPFDFCSEKDTMAIEESSWRHECSRCLIFFFFPLVGILVGWAMFLYGSLIASLTIISSSVVVYGSSMLLFVALGNYASVESRMAWLDLRKTDRDRESTLRDSRISAIDLRE
jgi:hypothetical protein